MSEEEKQVIKRLKDDIELVTFNGNLNYGVGNLYININDLKILLNLISKLQKELDKKDKVIDLMYQDIEYEYCGTSFMEYYSLENYYRRVEEENE